MNDSYDSEFQTKQEPDWHKESPLPRWNTYIIRTVLKGLSGLLFALSILPMIWYSWTLNEILFLPIGLLTFSLAIVVWLIFYRLETQYRSTFPDRVL
ncbi:MAG: hypothetical protein ACFFF4_04725 [Candidatus Thorarchaeota archaeon]